MIEFITLITLLCSQPQFNKSACIKSLFKACTQKQLVTNKIVMKDTSCLVENL